MVGTRAGDGFSLRLVRGTMQGRLSAETVPDQMKVVIYYKDPKAKSSRWRRWALRARTPTAYRTTCPTS